MSQPPSLPPDPDEVASAIVDGLLPAAEADRARRDPAVARRVEEIRQLRAALRATPPPPPGGADRAIAAALAAFDAGPDSGDRAPQHLRVAAQRPGASSSGVGVGRRSAVGRTWLAAAAAIVIVGLVAAGLVSQSADDGDETATMESAEDSAEERQGSEDEAETAEDTGAGAAPSESPSAESAESPATTGNAGAPGTSLTVPQLGAVDSAADLRDRVDESRAAGEDAATRATDPGVALPQDSTDVFADDGACAGLSLVGDPARGSATFVADAEFQGTPVRVHLYELDRQVRLVATDESCTDVVDMPYSG